MPKIDDEFISRELKTTEQLNNLEKYKTASKKVEFIREMKTGLGKEMKTSPSQVKVIKKTWNQKLMLQIKKIFTKF